MIKSSWTFANGHPLCHLTLDPLAGNQRRSQRFKRTSPSGERYRSFPNPIRAFNILSEMTIAICGNAILEVEIYTF
jgi:hypothetical protein